MKWWGIIKTWNFEYKLFYYQPCHKKACIQSKIVLVTKIKCLYFINLRTIHMSLSSFFFSSCCVSPTNNFSFSLSPESSTGHYAGDKASHFSFFLFGYIFKSFLVLGFFSLSVNKENSHMILIFFWQHFNLPIWACQEKTLYSFHHRHICLLLSLFSLWFVEVQRHSLLHFYFWIILLMLQVQLLLQFCPLCLFHLVGSLLGHYCWHFWPAIPSLHLLPRTPSFVLPSYLLGVYNSLAICLPPPRWWILTSIQISCWSSTEEFSLVHHWSPL